MPSPGREAVILTPDFQQGILTPLPESGTNTLIQEPSLHLSFQESRSIHTPTFEQNYLTPVLNRRSSQEPNNRNPPNIQTLFPETSASPLRAEQPSGHKITTQAIVHEPSEQRAEIRSNNFTQESIFTTEVDQPVKHIRRQIEKSQQELISHENIQKGSNINNKLCNEGANLERVKSIVEEQNIVAIDDQNQSIVLENEMTRLQLKPIESSVSTYLSDIPTTPVQDNDIVSSIPGQILSTPTVLSSRSDDGPVGQQEWGIQNTTASTTPMPSSDTISSLQASQSKKNFGVLSLFGFISGVSLTIGLSLLTWLDLRSYLVLSRVVTKLMVVILELMPVYWMHCIPEAKALMYRRLKQHVQAFAPCK